MSTLPAAPSCPSQATLNQFLHDELNAVEAVAVQAHIDSCAACQNILGEVVGSLTGPLDLLTSLSTLPEAGGSPAAPPPIQLPGYEVMGLLGRGGMGVVYKARQLRPGRVVAVKVLLAGSHAGSKERERFLREAGAVAQLQHPYIVSLYEAGEHGDLPYLTLEFVAGGSLAALLRSTVLPPREAARLVEQLARAAHYAHERGIIHRDLKPANVLLQIADLGLQDEAGATGISGATGKLDPANLQNAIPKITDFGLAKNVSGGDVTSSSAICGTPSYMAPEQAGGPAEGVGAAADVYALGAILYECLTGRPPFRGPTPTDTLLQVIGQEPVPIRHLQPTVPGDLETISLKCLQKKPRQRYASALELAEDLRRFRDGDTIRARPVGRWERLVKWCRRRPAVAALLAAVVFLTVAAAALVIWQWREAVAALADARREKAARAQRQVAALPDAAPGSVPAILDDLEASRNDVLPLLRQRYAEEKDQLRRMRLALALLPVDPDSVRAPLMDWMLQAEDPAEVLLARQALRAHRAELTPLLWAKTDDPKTSGPARFRAWVALAAYDSANPRWQKVGPDVVEHLLWTNSLHRRLWTEALRSLDDSLQAPLTDANHYPLVAGNKWHYKVEHEDGSKDDLLLQVAKIENIDGQPFARLEGSVKGVIAISEHQVTTAKGLFRHRMNGTEISPPIQMLKFPIQSGDTWESTHSVAGKGQLKMRATVGNEEVEVPAGKYKTVRVVLDLEEDGTKSAFTLWFAPGIGPVKQRFTSKGTDNFLLEKFERGSGD